MHLSSLLHGRFIPSPCKPDFILTSVVQDRISRTVCLISVKIQNYLRHGTLDKYVPMCSFYMIGHMFILYIH